MKLTDIKKALNTVMRSNFPDHKFLANEIEEGFVRSCFFIELLPVTRDNEGGGFYSRRITVVINYFSKDRTDLENLIMQDQLEQIFSETLRVGDRTLTILSTDGYVTDGVLHFSFSLDYVDSMDETEVAEFMQDLNLNM